MPSARPLRDRLLSRLIIEPGTGCLLWTGAKNSDGYGHIAVGRTMRSVHRVMYEMFAELIPDGLDLDHLCRVRHCASVAHLEPVTRRENTMRGDTPAAANRAKTRCPAGHRYNEANTYWYQGRRYCRPCHSSRTSGHETEPREFLVQLLATEAQAASDE